MAWTLARFFGKRNAGELCRRVRAFGKCVRIVAGVGGPCPKRSQAHSGGIESLAGAGHERPQSLCRPPFESIMAGRGAAEAMGAPWPHTMAFETTARGG